MAFTTGGSPQHAGQNALTKKHSLLTKLYLPQLIPAALLIIYGIVVIWSASLSIPAASFPRHILGIVVGLVAAFVLWKYDYRIFANYTTVLLILDVVLMVLPKIPGFGVTAKGMTGWVSLPFVHFNFQPSEVGKIVTILLVAAITAQYNGTVPTLKDYVRSCLYLIVPFVLINVLPDLGTGLIILVSGASIIICGGSKPRWYLTTIGLIVGFAALAIILSLAPGVPDGLRPLKTYQLNRLIVFIDPSVDPAGNGYNLTQAKIAVGSGGFLGKGIGNATQAASGFLPEAQTDFVFALLSEEFGFVGSIILLGLFAWMIGATILLAMKTDIIYGKLILVGCIALWTFQVLQNVGMCIGIMPITGIPLPFISFGSTSMVIQIAAVGIVQSIWRYRQKAA